MAYSQVAYRELGRYMANIPNSLPLLQFAEQYQKALITALIGMKYIHSVSH